MALDKIHRSDVYFAEDEAKKAVSYLTSKADL